VDPSKFQLEHDIVYRFVRELGYTQFSLSNPNAGQKNDSGADVLLDLNGRRYGIQVTVYHSDEGSAPTQKGSVLRRQEATYKTWTTSYALCGKQNPWSGLAHRLQSKCSKVYSKTVFDELILLVAASVPQWAGVVSTLLLDMALDINQMNTTLAPSLAPGDYSSAYLYNMMGIGGPSVYEWTKERGIWRKFSSQRSV
jgi:hypothetical protein